MNNLFSEQDLIKITLFKDSIKQKKLLNQLLIYCNDKVKLETFSVELIKFLLCQKDKTSNCDCENCQRISNKNYYDLKSYGDFLTTIKKEEIQSIIETFSYSALEETGIKVYVINGVDLLTLEAANSLLKFLEEPAKNTYAFLLTTNRSKVLDTIKSRCLNIGLTNTEQIFEFDNFKNNFITSFLNNFGHNCNYNFILIRQLMPYSNLECREIFLEFANIIKNKDWEKYNINDQIAIEKLNQSNFKLIEICHSTADYLLENGLNKDLILEKATINLCSEV